MVVVARAVKTALVVSSARATAGRLTTPALISANVHALYFIFLCSPVCWFQRQPQPNRGSTALPAIICDAERTGHGNQWETRQHVLIQPLRTAGGAPRGWEFRRFLCCVVNSRHKKSVLPGGNFKPGWAGSAAGVLADRNAAARRTPRSCAGTG